MKFHRFLWEKKAAIFANAILLAFTGFMLDVMKVNTYGIIFLLLATFLVQLSLLIYEYVKKNGFYKRICETSEHLERKYLISSLVERPDFLEAQIMYDVLFDASKSMNDQIARYRVAQREYKEYVEAWIHEIKMPIANIYMLCANNAGAFAGSVEDEAHKVEAYVEQAMVYAKSHVAEKDYQIAQVNIAQVVRTAVKKHARALISHQIKVEANMPDVMVPTDAKYVSFMLDQIISNSIKYKTQEEEAQIVFSIVEEAHRIKLKICDNGIGIDEKDISRVFDKGFTGENGRRFAKSTGIGLYLCRVLSEKMHMQIKVESEQGQGTVVILAFPRDFSIFLNE